MIDGLQNICSIWQILDRLKKSIKRFHCSAKEGKGELFTNIFFDKHPQVERSVISSICFIDPTVLFSCRWQPNTSLGLCTWWNHRVIYWVAGRGKAVSMLSSPGEFSTAFSPLSAFGDTDSSSADKSLQSFVLNSDPTKIWFSLICQDSRGLLSVWNKATTKSSNYFFIQSCNMTLYHFHGQWFNRKKTRLPSSVKEWFRNYLDILP